MSKTEKKYNKINKIPKKEYEKIKEVYEIMKDIDEKDTHYVALALKLNCQIWSNDNDLKKQNKKVKVYNTRELLEEFLYKFYYFGDNYGFWKYWTR